VGFAADTGIAFPFPVTQFPEPLYSPGFSLRIFPGFQILLLFVVANKLSEVQVQTSSNPGMLVTFSHLAVC
jgi:hypothetical protein